MKKNNLIKVAFLKRLCFIGLLLILSQVNSLYLGGDAIKNAQACGVNSHLWITDSAICQLPFGSRLRAFYSFQRHVDMTRLGSAFPDSGYAIDHEYGEFAHWPPFIQAYIDDFHERYGSQEMAWDQEALAEVAFIMGVAAHGYEDELFDSQFLRWVEQEDQANQDIIDPALDFLLIYEGHTELLPPLDFPAQGVSSALQRAGVEVSVEELETGVARVHQFALRLSQSPSTLRALVERDAPLIPWATEYYLNHRISGSLAHEPQRVAAMLEGVYQRLSGQSIADEVISHIDPASPMQLRLSAVASGSQAQWITLYFKTGVMAESIVNNIQLLVNGESIPFNYRATRWGGGQGYTRLFEVSPADPASVVNQESLQVIVEPGLEILGGEVSSNRYEFEIELCSNCESVPEQDLRHGGQQQGCFVSNANFADLGMMNTTDQDDMVTDLGFSDYEVTADLGMTVDLSMTQNREQDSSILNTNQDDLGMLYYDRVSSDGHVANPQTSNQGCLQRSVKGDLNTVFSLFLLMILYRSRQKTKPKTKQ